MSLVTINDVQLLERDLNELPDFVLVQPQSGTATDCYSIRFEGHVVGTLRRPMNLALHAEGCVPQSVPVGVQRPDLAAAYPDIPWAYSRSGFHASINALQLPPVFEAKLVVVMENKERIPLAVIRGRHASPSSPDSGPQPLIVTTLGRTGSTWTVQLLGGHPEIVAYPPFNGEIRCATYWADVAGTLSDPASYLQAARRQATGVHWWLGNTRRLDEMLNDDDMEQWLGHSHVEEVIHFSRNRIEAFYAEVAKSLNRPSPRYFVEKGMPNTNLTMLRHLYPGLKEIFLVRDFRDMLCSIMAFNKAKGVVAFGRHLADNDEQYVRELLGPDVNRLFLAWRQRSASAHLLRYEDLAYDTSNTLSRVYQYLGLGSLEKSEVDEIVATSIAKGFADSRAKESGSQRSHPTSASIADSLMRWQRDLDDGLREVCDEAFAEALRGFGYTSDREPDQAGKTAADNLLASSEGGPQTTSS
jgi:hypothetical protein